MQDDVLFRSMGFVKCIEAPERDMHPCIRMHAVVAEFVEVFALAQAGELRGRRKAILALKHIDVAHLRRYITYEDGFTS